MASRSHSSPKETNIDTQLLIFILLCGVITCIFLFYRYGSVIALRIKRIMHRNVHVVIMSTYGPSVEGSPFYENYVAQAMKYVLLPENKVSELVIVGGYTVDPSRSQSQAVLDFIRVKYPGFVKAHIPVTLDECGVTTWQNIQNAKKLMDGESISAGKITIFAEESREKKVYFFANTTFKEFIGNDKNLISLEVDPIISYSRREQVASYNSLQGMVLGKYITKNALITIISVPSGLPESVSEDQHISLFQEVKEYLDPRYEVVRMKERLSGWSAAAGFDTAKNLVEKGCFEYKQFLNK